MSGRPAVFLDRDGVLNELILDPISGVPESPLRVGDVRLLAGVTDAAVRLAQAGFALVCVSNQPAAAKGRVSADRLLAVHARVVDLLTKGGVRLDASRLCMHYPEGVVPELSRRCTCRKPAPGMLLDASLELGIDLGVSWIVGDTDIDIAAGREAGCRTMLIEHAASDHKRFGGSKPDLWAMDLVSGVPRLLAFQLETFR